MSVQHESDNCEICDVEFSREKNILKDSPSNCDTYKECPCNHYFCVKCLTKLVKNKKTSCPVCSFDFSLWLKRSYTTKGSRY